MTSQKSSSSSSSTTDMTSTSSSSVSLTSLFESAKREHELHNVDLAIQLYVQVIHSPSHPSTTTSGGSEENVLRLQEFAIYGLAELYALMGKASELRRLLVEVRPIFGLLPKARTAKIVRTLIDLTAKLPETQRLQEELCLECVEWCRAEKRTFLRHRVETRLAVLYHQQGKLTLGLALVSELLREVKKLDDKLLLVEIHLIESKLYYSIRNLAKSKAALTAARTNSNAIHCPPLLQGDIDLQSGILHAQEKDYKTAFSYFYEAFEAFSSTTSSASTTSSVEPITTTTTNSAPASEGGGGGGEKEGEVKVSPMNGNLEKLSSFGSTCSSGKGRKGAALAFSTVADTSRVLQALKLMLLAKIMCGQPEEVSVIMSGKHGLKYSGVELQALEALAKAQKERSLKMFEKTLEIYQKELLGDPVVRHHTTDLQETMLEQNLLRILEPFSCVEIAHVAQLIELPILRVQAKLSEMILDGKLQGTLDQGVGVIILFDKPPLPDSYRDVLTTLKNMADVVNTLYSKAQLAV